MDTLDTLFERYQTSGTAQEKAELATEYEDLLNELYYDFYCDKLTEDGVELFLPIIEKIEILLGQTQWVLKAQAYQALMSQSEDKKEPTDILNYGKLAIDALLHQLDQSKEDQSAHYTRLANVYYTLIPYIGEASSEYWQQGLQYMEWSVSADPKNANWILYFDFLYVALKNESPAIVHYRSEALAGFRNKCLAWEEQEGPLSAVIASQLQRLKDLNNDESYALLAFPEDEYMYWFEKSLTEDIDAKEASALSNLGHFYQKEGIKLERLDVLEKALSYFETMLYTTSDGGFAIYYISDTTEQMALVYEKLGMQTQADAYLMKALKWNEEQYDVIQSNFSLISHYAEFLLRCYTYQGAIEKPSLEFIKTVLQEAEALGEGYYSGPYYLHAQVALLENQPHLAVFYLCKNLLLHELNIEDSLLLFQQHDATASYPYLENFLALTLAFFKEIRADYYFSPKFTVAQLNDMTEEEIVTAWIVRKIELKKRKALI